MGRETTGYFEKLANLVRYYIIVMTEKAGSGHPTSSLSAVELTTALMFGGFFRYDADRPALPNNDRFVLSKGHASPLLYALWAAAGRLTEEDLLRVPHLRQSPGGPSDAPFPLRGGSDGFPRPGPFRRRRHGSERKISR